MYKKTKYEHHAEFVIRKRPQSIRKTLMYLNCEFTMLGRSIAMMEHSDYKVSPEEIIKVRIYTLRAFYCGSDSSVSESDLFGRPGKEKLLEFGLMPCLPDDAPNIRNAFLDQHLGSEVLVVHTPIELSMSNRQVFSLKHEKHKGLCIDGHTIAHVRIHKLTSVAVRVID